MADKKKIEKYRDKYWEDDRPGVDHDFWEQLVAPEDLDEVVRSHSARFSFIEELDPADFLPDRKKQEELLSQIYETAAKVLTPSQYKVFIMRYLFGLKEVEIAKQMDTSQAYVARTIPVVHYKIRKTLQLEPSRKRAPVKTKIKRKISPKRSKKSFRTRTKKSLKSS